MKKISNKIVFFGNERLATGVSTQAPTLRALLHEGYTVVALISSYKVETSRKNREPEIHAVARENNIPILHFDKLLDGLEKIKSLEAEVGVLVAFGKMVPQSIIDLFPRGIINIHPSLLPKHRGPTPIERVILTGEKETGVTIMQLCKKMDAGSIYAQTIVNVMSAESKQELADTLLNLGAELVTQNLPSILSGEAKPLPQDETKATYDQLISKQDGMLDFNKSGSELEREVRAYAIWPQSQTVIFNKNVVVTKAHYNHDYNGQVGKQFTTPDKKIGIFTKDGSLIVDELRPAGKNTMTAESFLAGYGQKR